jgi:type III secretory pathway component EscT
MKIILGILLGIFTIIYWNLFYSNLHQYWQSVKSNPDEAMENKAVLIRTILLQILMAGMGLFLIIYTLQLFGFTN